jgi:hypothetical protein
VAKHLFVIAQDRDERASQLCGETLLTLSANRFTAPGSGSTSPKQRRFALRSLVLGENFLRGYRDRLRSGEMTAEQYGEQLASAEDFQGADNLRLARVALGNLIDPSTEQGQRGQHLMLPFHHSLLWYDARPLAGEYTVRQVRMRGAGITLARLLIDPPHTAGPDAAGWGLRAVDGIKTALALESPLSEISEALESVLPQSVLDPPESNPVEEEAWELGRQDRLGELAATICRHAEGVMHQAGASGPARLWQLRSILALDLAMNSLRRSWEAIGTDEAGRFLVLALAGGDRQRDRVRLRSERSYDEARTVLRWATVAAIESIMRGLAEDGCRDWAAEFDGRTATLLGETVVQPLSDAGRSADFRALAQLAFENANYDRAGEGFRVLLESIGMSAGGTRYRYVSATPDLLAALVGALSSEMPMTSSQFFRRVAEEWRLVGSPEGATGTSLRDELDGAELALNFRRFEKLLIDAGLAAGLSDRTVLVGERAARRM